MFQRLLKLCLGQLSLLDDLRMRGRVISRRVAQVQRIMRARLGNYVVRRIDAYFATPDPDEPRA